jgi:hypothetical protein
MEKKTVSNKKSSRICAFLDHLNEFYSQAFTAREDKKIIGYFSRDGYFLQESSETPSEKDGEISDSSISRDENGNKIG